MKKKSKKNCLEVILKNEFEYKFYEQLIFKNPHCAFIDKNNELLVQVRFFHHYN